MNYLDTSAPSITFVAAGGRLLRAARAEGLEALDVEAEERRC